MGIGTFLASLLTGPIVKAVSSYLEKELDVQINKDKLKVDLEKEVLGTITKLGDTQAKTIQTELKSKDKLPRVWRAVAGISFAFTALFYIIIEPIGVYWLGLPEVPIKQYFADHLYSTLNMMLAGYGTFIGLSILLERFAKWKS